jgi:hypothetical protein
MGAKMVRQNRGGAVAYIGPNTGGQPGGITLLEGFVKTLPEQNEPTLGDCWTGAVTRYCDAEHLETLKPNADRYPPSIFFQVMKYMVFGDPALRLPGPSLRPKFHGSAAPKARTPANSGPWFRDTQGRRLRSPASMTPRPTVLTTGLARASSPKFSHQPSVCMGPPLADGPLYLLDEGRSTGGRFV